jgi:hypothetical protein
MPNAPTWRDVLDCKLHHGHITMIADVARLAGYRYFAWNGNVYETSGYKVTEWMVTDIPDALKDRIRAALLAMPDRAGTTTTIEGVNVVRTGVDGWKFSESMATGYVGKIDWAVQEIAAYARR